MPAAMLVAEFSAATFIFHERFKTNHTLEMQLQEQIATRE
jgi:hypothetical protein